MNTLKLKFKLNDNKEKSISLRNVKIDATQDDIKALGNYIAENNMLISLLERCLKAANKLL